MWRIFTICLGSNLFLSRERQFFMYFYWDGSNFTAPHNTIHYLSLMGLSSWLIKLLMTLANTPSYLFQCFILHVGNSNKSPFLEAQLPSFFWANHYNSQMACSWKDCPVLPDLAPMIFILTPTFVQKTMIITHPLDNLLYTSFSYQYRAANSFIASMLCDCQYILWICHGWHKWKYVHLFLNYPLTWKHLFSDKKFQFAFTFSPFNWFQV